ncbi:uncharacterized protein EV154DRAFT_503788 [Mucor mucedo]|uniref:uncharacterized protein n=1 Tax=Mucor mucedo TaxID=29922 RepID=UPI00221F83A8|nr:uncharacterized protein EV154DRAFT_503788 [Mucor mucedo]KAI7892857.1 hypothetical protein EV154DRAFT_503788 [Mucor mucedo]
MKSSFKLLLEIAVVISLFSSITQAFCVYNRLEGDGPSFLVYNVIEDFGRAFKKEIAQGGKECCPYDNGDCVIGRQRDYPLSLYIKFGFDRMAPREIKRLYTIQCEGGAGISVTGSNFDNIGYTCFKANGDVTQERLRDWVTA